MARNPTSNWLELFLREAEATARRTGSSEVQDAHLLVCLIRLVPGVVERTLLAMGRRYDQAEAVIDGGDRFLEEKLSVDAASVPVDPALESRLEEMRLALAKQDAHDPTGCGPIVHWILDSPSDRLRELLEELEKQRILTAAEPETTAAAPFVSTFQHLLALRRVVQSRGKLKDEMDISGLETAGTGHLSESHIAMVNEMRRKAHATAGKVEEEFLRRMAVTDSERVFSVVGRRRHSLDRLRSRIFDLICLFEIYSLPKGTSVRELAFQVEIGGYPRNVMLVASALRSMFEAKILARTSDASSFRTWDGFVLTTPLAEELYQALHDDPITDEDERLYKRWIDDLTRGDHS